MAQAASAQVPTSRGWLGGEPQEVRQQPAADADPLALGRHVGVADESHVVDVLDAHHPAEALRVMPKPKKRTPAAISQSSSSAGM